MPGSTIDQRNCLTKKKIKYTKISKTSSSSQNPLLTGEIQNGTLLLVGPRAGAGTGGNFNPTLQVGSGEIELNNASVSFSHFKFFFAVTF